MDEKKGFSNYFNVSIKSLLQNHQNRNSFKKQIDMPRWKLR